MVLPMINTLDFTLTARRSPIPEKTNVKIHKNDAC